MFPSSVVSLAKGDAWHAASDQAWQVLVLLAVYTLVGAKGAYRYQLAQSSQRKLSAMGEHHVRKAQ